MEDGDKWRRLILVASGVIATMSAATCVLAWTLADRLTRSCPVEEGPSPSSLDLPWRERVVQLPDGDSLTLWWIGNPEAESAILLCPPYRVGKSALLPVARACCEAGYAALLFDYRGQGIHAGPRVSLGYRETQDALEVVRQVLLWHPTVRLAAYGLSMGGAIAIMAAARETRILAVIADCAFAMQRNPVTRALRRILRIPGLDYLVMPVADRILDLRHGYRFDDVAPQREISAIAPRPILLIHGEQDEVVAPRDAYALHAASGRADLWVIAGAGHCQAHLVAGDVYVTRLTAFLAQALGTPHRAWRDDVA